MLGASGHVKWPVAMSQSSLPPLLVAFYANPDGFPPTFNAVKLLRARFKVTVVSRRTEAEVRAWPPDVRLLRVGPPHSVAVSMSKSAAAKARDFAGFVLALRRTIQTEAPRVAYAYDSHALLALWLAGCSAPIVYQKHEVEELDGPSPRTLGRGVIAAALRLSRRAAIVVFPEQNRADYYQRFVPGLAPPMVIPNFPDREGFPTPDWGALLDGRFARRQVFYRGALGPENGTGELVSAIASTASGTSLRVCGRGEPAYMAALERLVRDRGLEGRVDLAGFVPFDRLNEEALSASVGVLPYQAVSTNWTFGTTATNKLFEYAACGLPALAPDRPSYRAFFRDEPWVELVDVSDPGSIGAGIERVLGDRAEYERRCRAARRAFEERFNYQVVFAPLLDRIVGLAGLGPDGAPVAAAPAVTAVTVGAGRPRGGVTARG